MRLRDVRLLSLLALLSLLGCNILGGGGGGGAAPVITSFDANPTNITAPGQAVLLRWVVSSATSLTITSDVTTDTDPGAVTGTSVTVNPTATTTYTLTVTNSADSVTATTTVTLGAGGSLVEDGAAPTGTFSVGPTQSGPFTNDQAGNISSPSDERVLTVQPGGTFYAQVSYSDPGGIAAVSISIVNSEPAGLAASLILGQEVNGFTLVSEVSGCILDGSQTSVNCIYQIDVADDLENIDDLEGAGDEFAYVFRTMVTDTAGLTSMELIRGYVVVGSSNGGGGGGTTATTATTATNGTGGTTRYSLTVTKPGEGNGTVSGTGINCGSDCMGTYNAGTLVSLMADDADDSSFEGWGGACSGTGACTVTMSSDKSVTATFDEETDTPTPSNEPPTADAGEDQDDIAIGATVALDGSGTDDDGEITDYTWTLTAPGGTNVTSSLSSASAENPTFTAGVAGTYVASLVVTDNDGAASAASTVEIEVEPSNMTGGSPVGF